MAKMFQGGQRLWRPVALAAVVAVVAALVTVHLTGGTGAATSTVRVGPASAHATAASTPIRANGVTAQCGGGGAIPTGPCAPTGATGCTPITVPDHGANVLQYGAIPDGRSDNTLAFANAIAAVQAQGGGTVTIPAGSYAFTRVLYDAASVRVSGSAPVILQGPTSGPATAALIEHVSAQPLLFIGAAGSQVRNLTLNGRSFTAGPTLTVLAGSTTVDSDTILGATRTEPNGSSLGTANALLYPGPNQAGRSSPAYTTCNTVSNINLTDGINNDGFSFSYQADGSISGIHHYGSRLALYVDNNVVVDGYTYQPNPQCLLATNAFYTTNPSMNVLIENFTTYGAGGIIGGPADTHVGTNITLSNEMFAGTAGGVQLEIGAVNGLTIDRVNFAPSSAATPNTLVFEVDGSALNVTVTNSTLAQVRTAQLNTPPIPVFSSLGVTFGTGNNDSDTFVPYSQPTFLERYAPGGAPPKSATLTFNGGSWSNSSSGFNGFTNQTPTYAFPAGSFVFNTCLTGYNC